MKPAPPSRFLTYVRFDGADLINRELIDNCYFRGNKTSERPIGEPAGLIVEYSRHRGRSYQSLMHPPEALS